MGHCDRVGEGEVEGSRWRGEGADHPWLRLWPWRGPCPQQAPMLARRQLDLIWNLMGGEYKWCHQLDGGD